MQQIAFKGDNKALRSHGIERLRAQCDIHKPKQILFHIYCGFADKKAIGEAVSDLSAAFPQAQIAGVVSNGEIRDGHLQEQGILITAMLFDITEVKVTVFDNASNDPEGTGANILKLIQDTTDVRGVELLHIGGEYDPRLIFEEVEKCSRTIRIFGGISAGHALAADPVYLADKYGVYDDGIAVITYSGKGLWIDADRTAGWNRLGQAFTITKAEGKRLIEINGEPAANLFKHYLQISTDENFVLEAAEFPLMVVQDGEQMLRHPEGMDEDGSLMLAGDIREGCRMHITYGNPTDIIDEVNRRCENVRQFEPQAVLLYSCGVRKMFWEDFVDNELEPFSKIASASGFFTGGEILRNMRTGKIFVYNITLLSIAMREGTKTGMKAPRAVVDDSLLKGQVSLVRRLAKLVKATMDELQALNDQLSKMASMDELTNLYNRREIEHRINEAIETCRSKGLPVSLVMLDIDHFKRVNDTYGHDVGDLVLKRISAILRNNVNHYAGQAAGRWGGEEFFVLLPRMDIDRAKEYAEKLRQTIEMSQFPGVRGITASFGVICPPEDMKVNLVFKTVDDALYYSKEHGRNRVTAVEGKMEKEDFQ